MRLRDSIAWLGATLTSIALLGCGCGDAESGSAEARPLVEGEPDQPKHLAVGTEFVFWMRPDSSIMRAAKSDGAVAQVVRAAASPTALEAFDRSVAWADDDGVFEVDQNGVARVQLTSALALALAVDADHTYWIQAAADGSLEIDRAQHGGGTVQVVASGIAGVRLAADAGVVAWAADGEVDAVAAFGAEAARLADPGHVRALAVHGDTVLWIEDSAAGRSLRRIGAGGGSPVVLATGALTGALAACDMGVYFADDSGVLLANEGAEPTQVAPAAAVSEVACGKSTLYYTVGAAHALYEVLR